MKAMVFAAGQGTRLRPLTDNLPKVLVPVAGRPMIEYSLLLLRHYGIDEVVVNLHHLGEKIESHLQDGSRLGLRITYSREKELLVGGERLYGFPFEGFWQDLGTPERIKAAEAKLAAGEARLGYLRD